MRYEQTQIIKALKFCKFKIFTDKSLNIVGVRENFEFTNKFEDKLYIWSANLPFTEFNITTKAGRFWWENFTKSLGVASLVENQYLDAWMLGLHRGKYEALVQVKDVVVYRDNNKDKILDTGKTEKGLFGINIHRASNTWISPFVDKWSAGCQVFNNPKEYAKFMQICKDSGQKFFSYTLINQKIINKSNL